MSDQGFPIIEYPPGQPPSCWGQMHGESYRQAIRELYEIRLGLMREKNKTLTEDNINALAGEQWERTAAADAGLADELDGICHGSGLSRNQIVVVNNYTDFRDIQLPDEGCSSVIVHGQDGRLAGQTWDMHGTAKNYVCCIRIPGSIDTVLFSLVGCLGMMGYTSAGTMVGVNNINTHGAVPGSLWPVVVRKLLHKTTQAKMAGYLATADVTSGHSYLVISPQASEVWEVLPGLSERVGLLQPDQPGFLIHTNHCLGEHTCLREQPAAQNSTTHIRYKLLEKKVGQTHTFDEVYALLNDHENYPKSICSNFQSNAQDPSITCGGAVGDLQTNQVVMWRGDELYDANFKRHTFHLAAGHSDTVDREPPSS